MELGFRSSHYSDLSPLLALFKIRSVHGEPWRKISQNVLTSEHLTQPLNRKSPHRAFADPLNSHMVGVCTAVTRESGASPQVETRPERKLELHLSFICRQLKALELTKRIDLRTSQGWSALTTREKWMTLSTIFVMRGRWGSWGWRNWRTYSSSGSWNEVLYSCCSQWQLQVQWEEYWSRNIVEY